MCILYLITWVPVCNICSFVTLNNKKIEIFNFFMNFLLHTANMLSKTLFCMFLEICLNTVAFWRHVLITRHQGKLSHSVNISWFVNSLFSLWSLSANSKSIANFMQKIRYNGFSDLFSMLNNMFPISELSYVKIFTLPIKATCVHALMLPDSCFFIL